MRIIILSCLFLTGCPEITAALLEPDPGAGPVCGNGRVEFGEACDTDSAWCHQCQPLCRWPESGQPGFYGDCAAAAQCEHDLRREEVDRAFTDCEISGGDPGECLEAHAAGLRYIGRILHDDLDWCRRRAAD